MVVLGGMAVSYERGTPVWALAPLVAEVEPIPLLVNAALLAPTRLQGYLARKKQHPPVGLCLGPYDSPRGEGVFL